MMAGWGDYEGKIGYVRSGKAWIVQGGRPMPYDPSAPRAETGKERDAVAAKLGVWTERAQRGADFLQYNQRRGTGGMLDSDIVPSWGQPDKQNMVRLQNQMVQDSLKPGMAQTMNTPQEQAALKATLTTVNNDGPVNVAAVRDARIYRDLTAARLRALDDWAKRGVGLQGFESYWMPQEAQLREALKEYHYSPDRPEFRPGTTFEQFMAQRQQGGQPQAAPQGGGQQRLSPEQAAKLQPGTPFIGMDGVPRVRQ